MIRPHAGQDNHEEKLQPQRRSPQSRPDSVLVREGCVGGGPLPGPPIRVGQAVRGAGPQPGVKAQAGARSNGRPDCRRSAQASPAPHAYATSSTGPRRRPLLRLFAVVLPAVATACIPSRQSAVPRAQTEQAAVLDGLPNARFWADTQVPELGQEAMRALERAREHLGLRASGRLPPASFLALSGGSDDGAFGAGLLVGWTAAGDRPEFKLVTGVST